VAILPSSADYTDKDFDAIRKRMIALIRSVFPSWSDFSVSNFGNILMEAPAFMLDVLCFYQDAQARESRITTATQRRNLIALAKLLNYTPSLAVAATVDVTISVPSTTVDIEIPAGQVFKTKSSTSPVEFQLLAPVTLTEAAPSAVGTVENSTTEQQVYAGTGQPNQSVVLTETPFLSVVSIESEGGGDAWLKVDNFLFSGGSDRVFTVAVDNDDRATVVFSDGVSGEMPADNLTIKYKIGGGASGNVEAGTIVKVDGTIVNVDGDPVAVSVTNVAAASNGVDRESEASIRLRAPLSIRNPTASIARTDFEDHAITLAGVSRALMLTINEDASIADNSGRLYLVPAGNPPSYPSTAKLEEARRLFVGDTQARPPYPAPLTFSLEVLRPLFLDVSITARVWLTRGSVEATVRAAIEEALTNFFNPVVESPELAAALEVEEGAANPQINFGYYLRQGATEDTETGQLALSDLFNVVRDIEGVRKIGPADSDFTIYTATVAYPSLATSPIQVDVHEDVTVEDTWFPRFAALTLINGDTGESF